MQQGFIDIVCYYNKTKMPLAATFIYPVICALLQKIATGWQGLAPSDWCHQCFTNPANNKPLGNALRPLWGIRNTKTTGSMRNTWIPPLSSWHPDSCTVLQGWEEKNRLFPEIYTITAHCNQTEQWSFIKKNQKHSPRLKQMPDQHNAAKLKKNHFLFCPKV